MIENFTLGYYYYKLIDTLPLEDKESVFVSIVDYIFANKNSNPTKLNHDILNILKTKLIASEKHQLSIAQNEKEVKHQKELDKEYIEKRTMQYYNTIMAITDGDIDFGINILQYRINNSENKPDLREIIAMMKTIDILQWEKQKSHGELLSLSDNEANSWDLYGDLMVKIKEISN